ncbi:restriction endonuclease [Dietzia natronolimnaea]|uniref:restriction endonuclease n=1 Tax=Dietzia natronolimnaea TaxID=161920 RepID=UPI0015F87408|nr:restriction endonuclease [Dietzia natronolimnaea]MBB1037372.1 restriction endonuclease [Dietzia natronolimnaea]
MAIDGHLGPITPLQAEHIAAGIMRDHLGFKDARVTTASGDGGVDVVARQAVAQVKHWGSQVGRPAIQQLYGARGVDHAKKMVFFCSGGYSRQAIAYANEVGVALFTFDAACSYEPMNDSAREIDLTAKKEVAEVKKQADREARKAEWADTLVNAQAERQARQVERQARIDAGWVPMFTWRSAVAASLLVVAVISIFAIPDLTPRIILPVGFCATALVLAWLEHREYKDLKWIAVQERR